MVSPLPRVFFITGTDTHVGKTYCAVKILQAFNAAGFSTIGLKPLASGSERNSAGELRNEDALKLQAAASIDLPYSKVNVFSFEPPIAPHIAANLSGVSINAEALAQATLNTIRQYPSDIVVIEGAGGWKLPLNETEIMPDYLAILSRELDVEIILIVGMKLGCLNHALLSMESIEHFTKNHPVKFLAWIPNSPQGEMPYLQENIEYLSQRFPLISVNTIHSRYPYIIFITLIKLIQA